jgi:putative transposase
MRKTKFAKGEYYHVYNRGVDKRKTFQDERDYWRFLDSIVLMNEEKDGLMIAWRDYKEFHPIGTIKDFLKLSLRSNKPLVDVVAYCINPNHYHFILKQVAEKGIERFMFKLGTGYSMYFNKKIKRSGSLFQGPFKAVHISSNDKLLYLSGYVNCNSEVHGICKAEKYRWSSFLNYIGTKKNNICKKEIISSQFISIEEYKQFAKSVAKEAQQKKLDDKLLLD